MREMRGIPTSSSPATFGVHQYFEPVSSDQLLASSRMRTCLDNQRHHPPDHGGIKIGTELICKSIHKRFDLNQARHQRTKAVMIHTLSQ